MISKFVARRRIRAKLVVLSTVVAGSALLLAGIAFWIYQSLLYVEALKRESSTIAQMLGDNSVAALTFSDRAAATEIANTLRAEPRVAKACLFGSTGAVLATYARNGEPRDCPPVTSGVTARFTAHHLLMFHPVSFNGDSLGSVYLEVDLAEMYGMWLRFGIISTFVLSLATLFAMALSSKLQRTISEPILHLASIAGQVSGSGHYSLRAVKTSDDETGQLIDQFNDMMAKIGERDRQLQRAQDELETRVQERTQSLLIEIAERKAVEQSLVNAKLAAEAANAAKSGFLANMSHELRTPLNAILGYSEMLEEDARATGNTSAVTDLQRILFAGRHLLDLVNDVLDISKIEAGALQLHLETVHSHDMTKELVATVDPLARRNGNRLEFRVDDGGFIRVDVMRFRQSLLNLLSNACKFTSNGKISLTVSRAVEGGKEMLRWDVTDTGIGISDEDMKRLFQPFSQVDSSSTRRHGGTGLGLAISKRLCSMMGGTITLASTIGVGSTFTVQMPLVDPQ
ncbi:ATP-binding protein [Occallatibacter savannae]|uniref:ATP-binding protein n=1 Tax=Occallatibacter savannae TaxID=1002691 RepID=UPI000D69A950|nr:ATP-binding protein [Occallatibacter savannae]